MIWLRSSLFLLCQAVSTVPFALAMVCVLPLGCGRPYAIARLWCRLTLGLAERLCGLKYRVIGSEHIPPGPVIVLSKHQSAWETLFFPVLFPRQAHVVKRELLRIPFFGWGLSMMDPIAIDRGSAAEALTQLEVLGRDRLARGLWVVIFPEGTRVPPGGKGRYAAGGPWLAVRTGTAVLPVAHNAGEFWRKNAFLKYPGTITVSIGPPIRPDNMQAAELKGRVENWIETEMLRISRLSRNPASRGANEPIVP
jgi:1-acyl-sn-glycerol-3-phosphate acyltransferase